MEFRLYLIKEFQRLKDDENRRLSLAWNLNRTLSKLNYRIHTDAVKAHLIPPEVTPAQAAITAHSKHLIRLPHLLPIGRGEGIFCVPCVLLWQLISCSNCVWRLRIILHPHAGAN